jgi:CRP-like cAMP-binding protein
VGLLGYPPLHRIDSEAHARTVALAPKVELLENLALFSAGSRAVLENLAGAAVEVEFPPAAVIITEGEASDAIYVLAEGEVEVTASGETGGPSRVIRTMTAPTYFGEIGVLERIPRTATVTAVTACRCERIDGESLLNALSSSPPSSTLMENNRARLAVTHPSRRVTYEESTA